MNVAIIVIATGAYTKFFKNLYQSVKKYFLPGHEKTFLLLTDNKTGWPADVKVFPALHLPWPLPSLLRFDRFLELGLEQYDLVYYLDADQEVVATIGSEVIPSKGQLVAVTHPCSQHLKNELFETNPASAAYCNPRILGTYYHANFFGGYAADFLALARECAATVAKDFNNKIIAKWDDESHMNRYLASHPPKVLPSTYGYPSYDTTNNPDKKILHFAKDQDSMRAYRTTGTSASRGIVLLAAGAACYGDYAANFAASVLKSDPEAKITLFTTPSASEHLSKQQRGYFDKILPVPRETLYVNNIPYYNRFKLFLPHISPYDESLYFDVDSLWVSNTPVGQLFDFMKVHKTPIGGQCEAVVPINEAAVLFKGIKDLKPLEAFHPALTFTNKNFYQLHGQCLYCTKTATAIQVFDMALRLFDAMLKNELTSSVYWVWHGQPLEELCITLATGMVNVHVPDAVTKIAPVSVQSDGLKEIDPFSTTRFVISIIGYNTHAEAQKVGGYCMGEEVTALYVGHYNNKIDQLRQAGYDVHHYTSKTVQL